MSDTQHRAGTILFTIILQKAAFLTLFLFIVLTNNLLFIG